MTRGVGVARSASHAAHRAPQRPSAFAADQIDHVRDGVGIDQTGIGGYYDRRDGTPVGMEDVTCYPALFAELARRGYGQADLEKIASGNMLRVLKAVEAYAQVRAGDPPIEQPVAKTAEDGFPYPLPCCKISGERRLTKECVL